jgi:hypothetical protein
MFQFPGFASNPYEFRARYLRMTLCSANQAAAASEQARGRRNRLRGAWLTIQRVEGGFPHSEILGSKLVRSSPRLIAAYHVLHRLSAPRHPPNALKALDRSHDRCPPPLLREARTFKSAPSAKGTDDQKDLSSDLSEDIACLTHPVPRIPSKRKEPSLVPRVDPEQTECVTSSRCQTPARRPKGPREFQNDNTDPVEPPRGRVAPAAPAKKHLVEPDGIEPTTSCLQSTRSPN